MLQDLKWSRSDRMVLGIHKTLENLDNSNQWGNYLLTLEALQIEDVKPSINTKDELRSR